MKTFAPINNATELVEIANQHTSLLIKQQEKLCILDEAYKQHTSQQTAGKCQITQQQEQIHALLLIKQQEKLCILDEAYKQHTSQQTAGKCQITQQQEQIHALQSEVRSCDVDCRKM